VFAGGFPAFPGKVTARLPRWTTASRCKGRWPWPPGLNMTERGTRGWPVARSGV